MTRILALLLLLLLSRARAEDLRSVPELTGHVVDLTGTLSSADKQRIDARLAAFEAEKGSQVAVLIVTTTRPEEIESYSIRVADKWKLGRKQEDDGVILLVAKEDRTLRLEVGYGLEGALSDLAAKRIVSDIITPHFKQGDFAGGVDAGVDAILQVIQGEGLPAPEPGPASGIGGGGGQGQGGGLWMGLLALAFFLSTALRAGMGRVRGGIFSGGLVGVLAFFMLGSILFALVLGFMALLFAMLGGGSRSGVIRGGGLGAFGGRGGGFGGFGGGFVGRGGGFGGGGASGRW